MIDHKRKLIFIHIPRTGGTSIERMAGVIKDKSDKHHIASEIKAIVSPECWDEYFKFTIRRHPYQRICSVYKWLYHHEEHPMYTTLNFIDWLEFIKTTNMQHNAYKTMSTFLDLPDENITEFIYEVNYKTVVSLFDEKNQNIHVNKTHEMPEYDIIEAKRLVNKLYYDDYQRWGYYDTINSRI